MILNLLALLGMGLLASLGGYFLKCSTANGLSIKVLLRNRCLYLGGFLYIASAFLNLYLLKKLPYSLVVPLGALTYIWTLVISHRMLGETITRRKVLGISTIALGVVLVAVG